MKLTLAALDEAFDNLWLNTNQLPILLHKWQEMVSEYLAEVEPTEQLLADFETRMNHWHAVLEENRTLFEAHQASLKDSIKTGEPSPKKAEQSEKYKR